MTKLEKEFALEKKEKTLIFNAIQNKQNELVEKFSHNEFKPSIRYNMSKYCFTVDYNKLMENDDEVMFQYSLSGEEDEIIVRPIISTEQKDNTSQEEFASFLKTITELNDIAFDFINKELSDFFKNLMFLYRELKKLSDSTTRLLENIEQEKITLDLNEFYKQLPKIKSFCIDTFLCEKFNIKFDIKPNRKNIRDAKQSVINSKKDAVYEFLTYRRSKYAIVFHFNTLVFSKYNGSATLITTYNKEKAKIRINHTLKEQFLFNNEIVSEELIVNSPILSDFFDKGFVKNKTYDELYFSTITNKMPLFAKRAKIENF